MCKCAPEIRTPFCGRGNCLPPGFANLSEWLGEQEAAAQMSLDRVWEQAVRQALGGFGGSEVTDEHWHVLPLWFGRNRTFPYRFRHRHYDLKLPDGPDHTHTDEVGRKAVVLEASK